MRGNVIVNLVGSGHSVPGMNHNRTETPDPESLVTKELSKRQQSMEIS